MFVDRLQCSQRKTSLLGPENLSLILQDIINVLRENNNLFWCFCSRVIGTAGLDAMFLEKEIPPKHSYTLTDIAGHDAMHSEEEIPPGPSNSH
jgi:hypothetical protein